MRLPKSILYNRTILSIMLLTGLVSLFVGCSKNDDGSSIVLRIGSGNVMGLFNPTATVLTKIINTDISRNEVIAEDVTTEGSGDNINRLLNGKLNCALSDDIPAVMAFQGDEQYKNVKNHNKLRSLSSFFCDSIIFVVNANSGIESFADIKGKKIAIADKGTAAIGDVCEYMLSFYNIKNNEFTRLSYDLSKSVEELEHGRLDGFLYVTALPNPYLIGLSHSKKIKYEFIQFHKELLQMLKDKFPSLTYIKIPSDGVYAKTANQTEITTLGCRVLLITTTDMKDDIAYYLTKEICKYFPAYESVYQLYKEVTPESMAKNLTIPVHQGAYRYYEEAGLAKFIPENLKPKSIKQ